MHLKLADVIHDRLAEMAETLGMTKTELIRISINEKYDTFAKTQYGYQSGTATVKHRLSKAGKKEEQNETLRNIRQYADQGAYEELNAILLQIGYIEEPKASDDGWVSHETFTSFSDFGGPGLYRFKYKDKTYRDRAFVFDIDQLIHDLIKNKYV